VPSDAAAAPACAWPHADSRTRRIGCPGTGAGQRATPCRVPRTDARPRDRPVGAPPQGASTDGPARPAQPSHPVLTALALCTAAAVAPAAAATDLLGLSIGAGLGQTNVKVDRVSDTCPLGFSEHDTGWKAYVTVRPLEVFGVEVEYLDFGHPTATIAGVATDGRARGAAAFAVGYLPLPLVDLYAKAGVARQQTTATGTTTGPIPIHSCSGLDGPPGLGCPFRIDRTDPRVAYGVGVQVTLSALALRAEFEQFATGVGDQNPVSLSRGWRF
jgi:hypothetical protein